MRLSKRIITIALVLALTISSATLAFAQQTMDAEARAEVLHELGLFLGVDAEVFTPNLDGATDRAAAMVMVARALGWMDAEDWDEDAVSGFTDVPDWAEPSVAYAVDRGITVGIGDNLFGNDMRVTERQLETWFDRALGKGDTWVDNEDLDDEMALDRADLVNGTWETLMEVPVGGEQSLIATIVADDAAMMHAAMASGLMETTEVDIDPDDYDVTIDDMEMGYYLAGDTLELTLNGLEPLTEQAIFVLIQHGQGGFPFTGDPIFEDVDEDGLVGIVKPDGTLTVSGVLLADLPEGPFAVTVPGYGYTIDNTLSLTFDENHIVTYGEPEGGVDVDTVTLNDGEDATLAVGATMDLGDTLVAVDQYNHPLEVEGTFSSDDEEVVTVDATTGELEAVGSGVATVSFAVEDGPTAEIVVTVTE
ncbi:MAG: Ig-like domain-containing protein [Bacillota bacterium]